MRGDGQSDVAGDSSQVDARNGGKPAIRGFRPSPASTWPCVLVVGRSLHEEHHLPPPSFHTLAPFPSYGMRPRRDQVTSGEPHAFMALNALHFAAFADEACRLLVGE
jgi:hypothetical protein